MTIPLEREATAQRIWDGMRILVLEAEDRRRQVSEALGMSFFRAKALRRIAKGPMTMRVLAEKLATDAPYTTLIVDDLERQGLVERSVNPNDRRSKLVSVTEAGREAAEAANRILQRPPARMLELDDTDLATLERIMESLLDGHDY